MRFFEFLIYVGSRTIMVMVLASMMVAAFMYGTTIGEMENLKDLHIAEQELEDSLDDNNRIIESMREVCREGSTFRFNNEEYFCAPLDLLYDIPQEQPQNTPQKPKDGEYIL